ncbi:DMT family transporter [Aliivibrio sp. S3MY1]|uniref:DMT family transporter n=1 Tax=unclassified Aliivibrio TaxID=2645654 RepID=UPI0023792DF5|nr:MULTISPECIES: DMT family transporter [unclassified Aliivibrio]MDD9194801.1 DMT family transporter [Aliivibrio sp. S3MY1]MDD9198658.1 DMT family transporter [Aliivibrio sp. S2MY1]
MSYLLSITLLWAFSFSLIGVYLAGQVDAWFSVLMRIGLATLIFIPFLRPKQVSAPIAIKLMLIGAIQLGLMYIFYYQSFLYLTVPEVLLFTVMTPIYITLLNDAFEGKFHPHFMISAVIATLGAITIRYNGLDSNFLLGFAMVQGANLCFATGQVCYKRLMKDQAIEQKNVFGFFFIGALIVATVCYAIFGNSEKLPTTTTQWGILVYLGTIASGLGYFMWNKGATLVNVGVLAVMNNLLIPAGILVNLLIWNHDADILRLSLGGGLILIALLVNQQLEKKRHQ